MCTAGVENELRAESCECESPRAHCSPILSSYACRRLALQQRCSWRCSSLPAARVECSWTRQVFECLSMSALSLTSRHHSRRSIISLCMYMYLYMYRVLHFYILYHYISIHRVLYICTRTYSTGTSSSWSHFARNLRSHILSVFALLHFVSHLSHSVPLALESGQLLWSMSLSFKYNLLNEYWLLYCTHENMYTLHLSVHGTMLLRYRRHWIVVQTEQVALLVATCDGLGGVQLRGCRPAGEDY